MAGELWDLYDAQGKRTGKVMTRGEEVPSGYYHLAVHIWPVNSKGEFLVQRRAATVQWKPNLWAVTGGSAISGEDALTAARRELLEEIGYNASIEEMHQIACLRRTNSFCCVFAVHTDWPEDSFTLQQEEVSAVAWCTRSKLTRMLSDNMLYNYGDAYYRMLFDYGRRRAPHSQRRQGKARMYSDKFD